MRTRAEKSNRNTVCEDNFSWDNSTRLDMLLKRNIYIRAGHISLGKEQHEWLLNLRTFEPQNLCMQTKNSALIDIKASEADLPAWKKWLVPVPWLGHRQCSPGWLQWKASWLPERRKHSITNLLGYEQNVTTLRAGIVFLAVMISSSTISH